MFSLKQEWSFLGDKIRFFEKMRFLDPQNMKKLFDLLQDRPFLWDNHPPKMHGLVLTQT
jgi:hypothetical protein